MFLKFHHWRWSLPWVCSYFHWFKEVPSWTCLLSGMDVGDFLTPWDLPLQVRAWPSSQRGPERWPGLCPKTNLECVTSGSGGMLTGSNCSIWMASGGSVMVVFFSSVPEVEGSSSVQFCGVVFSLVPRSLVFLLCYFATILLINIFLPHHQDHFLLVAMEPFLACSLPFLSLWACSVVLPWVFELDTLMIFHYFNFIVCAFFTTLLRYNSHTICPFIVQ